jgi:hypothetical protein
MLEMRRVELREIEINLYLAKKRFEGLTSTYRKDALDARPTPDDKDNADIVTYADDALYHITQALDGLDQIEERLDSIATRRRVS